MSRLLLLCERGGFAPLHQATSLAAAALSEGRDVDLVLFHGALGRFLGDSLDDTPQESYRAAIDSGRVRPVSEVLARAREDGLRVFACSASVALLGLEPAQVAAQVDETIGWPTILRWMDRADQVLYL